MLEIILLFALGRRVGNIVRAKGHKAGLYQFLLVILWFGGEILGAIFGAIVGAAVFQQAEPMGFAYLFALLGAAAGAVVAFVIAKNLPPTQAIEDEKARAYFEPPPPLVPGGPTDQFRARPSPELPRSAPDERFKP